MSLLLPGVVASSHVTAAANGAIRINASGQRYTRSASGLNADMSWCCWAKLAVNRATYSMILSSDNAGSNYYASGAGADGTGYGRIMTGGDTSFFGKAFTVGAWVFIGAVHGSAVTDQMYWRLPGDSSISAANGSDSASSGLFDANTFYIGDWGFSSWWNGSIAAVKIWTAALTQSEIDAERSTYAAVRTSNLWAAYSFRNGVQTTDDSGNSRTLTQTGTPILDSSGPPIT